MISRPVLIPKDFWVRVRAIRDYVPVDTTSDARKLQRHFKVPSSPGVDLRHLLIFLAGLFSVSKFL